MLIICYITYIHSLTSILEINQMFFSPVNSLIPSFLSCFSIRFDRNRGNHLLGSFLEIKKMNSSNSIQIFNLFLLQVFMHFDNLITDHLYFTLGIYRESSNHKKTCTGKSGYPFNALYSHRQYWKEKDIIPIMNSRR